ncbi:MAG: twin-arginine translocase subunit TatC [Planctomycetota bacterium]|jgi:sec-independent protein translocase protein TatC
MGGTKKKDDILDSTMNLGDHLEELRARLILAILGLAVGTIICLFFGKYIIGFIQRPYTVLMENNPELERLKFWGPPEAFTAYMKISVIAGLILSSPWVFYQLWMFVAAGLYVHERRYVRLAVPFSAGLFIVGAMFFLHLVAPLSLKFFLMFGKYIDAEPMWTLQKYVSFITMLMLVFGIGFQTPIAIFILNRTGLVSIDTLCRSRKYVFLAVFVIAAVATPPDPMSQVMLGLPLYMLFELGILLSSLAGRRKKS